MFCIFKIMKVVMQKLKENCPLYCSSAILVLAFLFLPLSAYAGVPVPFAINMDETVVVTGSPRLQLDVGGVTRYAPYVSGSGTSTLNFAYPVVSPDFDRDGITLFSPLDLNGGTIKDVNGNNANLTFVPPNTSGVKLQSYTAAWTTSPINGTNEAAAAFNIVNAPTSGTTYNYSITSSGGGGAVTGSGSVTANPNPVTGVDVSSLPAGTLTVSVTVTNATGTGNAKTDTVTATAFTGALDSLPASAAAYSVRRLRSAYIGALMRVRRSSDNAEQDIGYTTLGGNLDTTALSSFCGASSCFVKTWYDQSGNTKDATQTTDADQPRIVNAGVIETQNGKPSIRAYGNPATISLNITSAGWGVPTGWTLVSVGRTQVDPPGASSWTGPYASADCSGLQSHLPWTDGIVYDAFGSTARKSTVNPVTTLAQLNVYSVVSATNSWSNYLNGSVLYNTTANTFCATPSSGVRLFFSIGGAYYLDGYVSEANIFISPLSNTDRSNIENNQKSYFATP